MFQELLVKMTEQGLAHHTTIQTSLNHPVQASHIDTIKSIMYDKEAAHPVSESS